MLERTRFGNTGLWQWLQLTIIIQKKQKTKQPKL